MHMQHDRCERTRSSGGECPSARVFDSREGFRLHTCHWFRGRSAMVTSSGMSGVLPAAPGTSAPSTPPFFSPPAAPAGWIARSGTVTASASAELPSPVEI